MSSSSRGPESSKRQKRTELLPVHVRSGGGSLGGRTSSSSLRWSTEAVKAREQAREEERRRLARELHDELGQALTGFKMDLAWVEQRLQEPSSGNLTAVREKVRSLRQLVDQSSQTLGAIVTDLRPPALDQLGLVAALEWQAETFARRAGLRCQFSAPPEPIPLDNGRATAVFRMFQEMLTNVARHANASKVTVSLRRPDDRLLLTVRDNGRGVDAKQTLAPRSSGLLGMRERALLLGGTLEVISARRRGTVVTVSIPLANRRARSRPDERA